MNRLTRILRSESGYTDTLGYNLAGEVTSANYAFSGRSITYTIDKAGNRTRVIDGGVTKNYTSNSINQYTAIGGVVPVYIGGHALQSYGTQTCYYIAGTYLVKAVNGSNTLLLYYDALGRCVKQTLNGVTTYHIFDGDHWILENNASDVNTITVLYGREMDEVIAVSNNGTPYFYFPDRNGNISAVLNLAGGVAEFYRYDRFGLPTFYGPAGGMLTGTQIGNRFLFTGREWDAGVGLYEYRHRGYNPVLGRFMSEDPKGFDAGDYNLYRYCGNDPLDLSDPMGMQPEGAWQPPVMPHPFISTIVEGAGTVGAQQPRINVQGRNSQMQIPTKRYDTPWRAGLEAVGDGQYDSAKSEHFQREFNFPLAQVNGVAEGEYFHGGLLAGVGVSGPGQKYSGWQVSYIERLADYIPIGSHLVGYATIHPHFDPGTVSKVDLPNFERGFHIPAHILLKAPFNFNSDTPRTQYIVGTCKYCNQ
jgi:RHS repeat-associated protein